MSYKGRALTAGNYLKLDDLSSFFNGTQKTFNLTSGGNPFYPGSAFSILVVLGGVIQEPESAYTIDQSQITFASAPGASDDFFCIALGVALGVGVPADGTVTPAKLTKPFNYNDGHLTLDTTNDRVGINSSIPGYTLDVRGDTRIVGILTVGTSSIVLDGSNNTLRVGSGVTITSTEINASSFVGSLTGNATGLSGTPNIAVGSITAASAVISGSLSIGSTFTSSSNFTAAGPFTITQQPFFQNVQGISTDFTVQSIYNAMSIGPIGINTGVTVVISTGANWVIV